MVAVSEYFDLFINVTLGIGVVFELPVLLFLLTLLHIVSPAFLLINSRYAVLALTIIAAVISPTQDVVNLMVLLVPMCALYFVGVFASYSLVLRREQRRFPWKKAVRYFALIVGVATVVIILWLIWRALAR
jgi:sec-independent protein translocase protein TatC